MTYYCNVRQDMVSLSAKNYGKVLEVDCGEGHFDLVMCNDVIEHMFNRDKFLKIIRTKLVSGEYLV